MLASPAFWVLIIVLSILLNWNGIIIGKRRIMEISILIHIVFVVVVIKVGTVQWKDVTGKLRSVSNFRILLHVKLWVLLKHILSIVLNNFYILIIFSKILVKVFLVVIVSLRETVIFIHEIVLLMVLISFVKVWSSLIIFVILIMVGFLILFLNVMLGFITLRW